MNSDESDIGFRWFRIEQDRRRERKRRRDRERRRQKFPRQHQHPNATPAIKTTVTGWEIDELGNLSRSVYTNEASE